MKHKLFYLTILFLAFNIYASPPRTFLWNTNIENTVSGYQFYIGTNTGIYYTNFFIVNVTNTTLTLTNLTLSTNLYFAVKAIDTNGLSSDYSNEIFLIIPAAPVLRLPSSILLNTILQRSINSPAGPYLDYTNIPLISILVTNNSVEFFRTKTAITYNK